MAARLDVDCAPLDSPGITSCATFVRHDPHPRSHREAPRERQMALAWGDHLALTTTSPDRTYVLDLRAWPLSARAVPGLFATSMARTASGGCLLSRGTVTPTPTWLDELDLASGAVKPLALGAPWHEPQSVFALGDRVLVTPGGTLRVNGHRPAWWRDGDLTPLDLALPALPTPVTHAGKQYVMPDRMDRVDAFALPDGDALVIWFSASTACRARPSPPSRSITSSPRGSRCARDVSPASTTAGARSRW